VTTRLLFVSIALSISAFAQTAVLTPAPKFRAETNAGVPCSTCKVYTYLAGTTTPSATYTDYTGGTPNTNPIILDSRGEANIWLGPRAYKIELKTSLDVLIWTVDQVFDPGQILRADLANTTDPAKGDALVGFKQPVTGGTASTVHEKLSRYLDVKDFGAVCDGTTNTAATLQAAADYAAANGYTLYFPPGVCNIGGTTLHKEETSVWLGSGFGNYTGGSTLSPCPTSIKYTGTSAAVAVYSAHSFSIVDRHGSMEKMCIDGPGHLTTSIGLYMGGDPAGVITPTDSEAARLVFRDIRVSGFGTGLKHGNHFYLNTFDNAQIVRNGVGLLAPTGTFNAGENVRWIGGLFADNLNGDVELNGVLQPRFFATSFDYQYDPMVHSYAVKGTAVSAEFHGCHFEKQYGPIMESTSGIFGVKIFGGTMLASNPVGNGETGLIRAMGTGTTRILVYGLDIFSNHAINYFLETTPASPDTAISLNNITGNQNNTVVAMSSISAAYNGNSLNFGLNGGESQTGVDSNTLKASSFGRSVDVAPPPGVNLLASQHATSRRASLAFDNNWQIGQDSATSGVKDFFIYNNTASFTTMRQTADGTKTSIGPAAAADYTLSVGDFSGPPVTTTIKQGVAQGTSYLLRFANNTDTFISGFNAGGQLQNPTTTFAALDPAAPNGTQVYCEDCTKASPTAGGGTGAIVKREGGAWNGN
jgi:hypothetical protein